MPFNSDFDNKHNDHYYVLRDIDDFAHKHKDHYFVFRHSDDFAHSDFNNHFGDCNNHFGNIHNIVDYHRHADQDVHNDHKVIHHHDRHQYDVIVELHDRSEVRGGV
jgi:hypothetical protein